MSYSLVIAESPKDFMRKGNKSYQNRKYNEAEEFYRKSLEKEPKNSTAIYNLGNSLYRQKKFEESLDKYLQVANSSKDSKIKANAFYNLGNSYLKGKKYNESIEAYKKALRLNPKDVDAKYNLEYARRMLLMEQEQKQQNQKKNENQQQQNSQQNQAQNNPQDKNQQNQNQTKQQSAPQPKMTSEQIQNLLNALQSEEKKAQKEIKAKILPRSEKHVEKNW